MGDVAQPVIIAIFWLKTGGGWRETPQSHKVAVADLTKLSDEELERMIGLETAVVTESTATYLDRQAIPAEVLRWTATALATSVS